MLRSLKDMLKFLQVLAPAGVTASVSATGFNCADFGQLTFLVNVGATTGNDFSGTHKLDILVQHSDVDVDGSYANAADADIYNAEDGANGIAKSLDATSDASMVHVVSYRGNKQFARIRLVETGTVDVPVGIVAVGGMSRHNPAL